MTKSATFVGNFVELLGDLSDFSTKFATKFPTKFATKFPAAAKMRTAAKNLCALPASAVNQSVGALPLFHEAATKGTARWHRRDGKGTEMAGQKTQQFSL